MDDYKKLIDMLRDKNNCDVLDYIEDAADAIETLSKERDAAIRDIRRNCGTCKYAEIGTHDEPCVRCACCYGYDKNWEWRGA